MDNIRFLQWKELLALHEEQLSFYGGQAGFIDESTVRSVMARAQFTAQYLPDADLADLAADYMLGLATTQGFLDGNKRTALVAAERFLRKNEWRTVLSPALMYLIAMAVARGEVDREGLADFCGITWWSWNVNERGKRRMLPKPGKWWSFREAVEATHRQYAWTFKKLAEAEDAEKKEPRTPHRPARDDRGLIGELMQEQRQPNVNP